MPLEGGEDAVHVSEGSLQGLGLEGGKVGGAAGVGVVGIGRRCGV